MAGCKILDTGSEATHFGTALGGGFFIHRDADDKTVTICRHPGENVRATPDVAVTLTAEQWAAADSAASTTPTRAAKRVPVRAARRRGKPRRR